MLFEEEKIRITWEDSNGELCYTCRKWAVFYFKNTVVVPKAHYGGDVRSWSWSVRVRLSASNKWVGYLDMDEAVSHIVKAIRIFQDCKELNLGKFTTCGGIQLSSPPVLWGYKSIYNKRNSTEMKRSWRVDNPSAQEKSKHIFFGKSMRIWKLVFFRQ